MTKKKTNSPLRSATVTWRKSWGIYALAAVLALPGSAVLRGVPAQAQHGPVQRVAEGTVEDKSGVLLKGAVVYLMDTKSMAIKSYMSNDQGYFHFTQLSPDTDYEIWAEIQGVRSKSKSISSFNTSRDFHFTLKIDK